MKKYIHITAGRGPAECCWVVTKIFLLIVKECAHYGFKYKVIDEKTGPKEGTNNSILIELSGGKKLDMFQSWAGTIQWIGESPYRKYHKRKNWFIGLSILEEKESKQLLYSDLSFQTFRASGPGGQHRNKVDTAVRVIHNPTKLYAVATESRSQQQNKKVAILKLEEMFKNQSIKEEQKRLENKWKEHLSLVRGNPVKLFVGPKFKIKT